MPVWVFADAVRLEQVFANLIGNAIKYTPPGGRIAVWLHLREHSVVVRIRDSGVDRGHGAPTGGFDLDAIAVVNAVE